jgi:hypothetical protein
MEAMYSKPQKSAGMRLLAVAIRRFLEGLPEKP